MSQQSSLYRTTKTRNAKHQDQLRSSLLVYKQSNPNRTDETSYHQTYGVPLPEPSVNILNPVINGLTGMNIEMNIYTRSLYTIGIWRENTNTIYRCCFIQPELSSATCSMPASWKSTATDALNSVSNEFPDAHPCTLHTRNRFSQLSGRMTPYVVEKLPFEIKSWGFANISLSYFLFLKTDDISGSTLLTLSRDAIEILRSYFPSYSVCVYDVNTNSYKVTVAPDDNGNINEANKNTCIYIYGDGSFRLQGRPSMMMKVCSGFRDAIHSIAKSNSWNSFTSKLIPPVRK